MKLIYDAYIFDLDGTIVDSKLDFDLMRSEMNFPQGAPILEHLESIKDPEYIKSCHQIIHKHEMHGAEIASPYQGVLELIQKCKEENKKVGILTRNSKIVTEKTLEKIQLSVDTVLTRDDCLAKPNPEGLLIMLDKWNITPQNAIYIGDFEFDILTAKNAQMDSALFLNGKNQKLLDNPFIKNATHIIEDYQKVQICP